MNNGCLHWDPKYYPLTLKYQIRQTDTEFQQILYRFATLFNFNSIYTGWHLRLSNLASLRGIFPETYKKITKASYIKTWIFATRFFLHPWSKDPIKYSPWDFCNKRDHNGQKMTLFKFYEKLTGKIFLSFCVKLRCHV